jgi:hypothetical protein
MERVDEGTESAQFVALRDSMRRKLWVDLSAR